MITKSIQHNISHHHLKAHVEKDTKYIKMHHSRLILRIHSFIFTSSIRTNLVCFTAIIDEIDDEESLWNKYSITFIIVNLKSVAFRKKIMKYNKVHHSSSVLRIHLFIFAHRKWTSLVCLYYYCRWKQWWGMIMK